MNYRHESRQVLKRARAALESNDDQNLKYAALELRMAMEALTYDRAKAYKDEFPPDEYETWQPRKVMAVLLEIDATADKDSTLSYGLEETPGQPASQMTMIGTETVLNMETLRRHYDALGSFLHVPTLKQTKSGKGHDHGKLRMRCTEIAEYLDKVLTSPVHNVTLGNFATIDCAECGKPIRKRIGTVKTSTLALALRSEGFSVEQHDGFLLVEAGDETPDLQTVLAHIRSGEPVDLFAGAGNLMSEKFHPYLSQPLLELDAISSKLAPDILTAMVGRM